MANAGDYQVADGDDDDDGLACQLICVPSYSRLFVCPHGREQGQA